MPTVMLDLDPGLRALVPATRRGRPTVVAAATDTFGHVVQTVGVPLTEVGGLSLDGTPVRATDAASSGVLRVAEVARPQAAPTDPPRFLLDVHLGRLARHLRLLGLDAAWSADADDADLADRSAVERRVLLTRDRLLLHRRAVLAGALVRGSAVGDQLEDVLDRFAPPLAPWTRCMACGAPLQPVTAADVAAEVPAGTRRTYHDFSRCSGCSRILWRGAHARRLDDVVAGARVTVARRRP